MSNFAALRDVGITLKQLLENSPWEDIRPGPEITFKSPKEIKDNGDNRNIISIFLYEILENPFHKNDEPEMTGHPGTRLLLPPLALDLLYLITPYSADKIQEQYILGKVMQIFHDNAILTGTVLKGTLAGLNEVLRLRFQPMSLDDLTKIWNVFPEVGYRLCVSYLVTPVRIDSSLTVDTQRVTFKEMNNYHMVP